MYLILLILFAITLVIIIKNIRSQAHVENKSYDIMLSTLLKHDVPEISVADVKKDSTILLLDARAYKEYEISHIKNALWVGYTDFDIHLLDTIQKNSKIVVYCSVGYRSEKIAEKLINSGFTHTSNLYGGIFDWVNTGNMVFNMQNEPTQQVHAYSKTWGLWLHKGVKVFD